MEKSKKKHTGSNILIIMLILIILASTGIGLYSWAKYRTTVEGTATGQIAKWSFKVTDGNSQTDTIDFIMSRKDNNASVAENKLAPGTYGELEIEIDASETETALTYIIEGETTNLPTNIKLYSNPERTEELIVVNGKFSYGGYMSLQEIGKRTEIIYWEWPFETGTTTEEKTANNKIDTEDSGKTMNMNVTVTGRQVNGEPRLADLVQIGDYVNYDASSNGTYTFTPEDCANLLKDDTVNTGNITINNSETISTDEKFNGEAKAQWRVLSVDRQSGTVELMAINSTAQSLTLSGRKGFVYAEEVLKNIGIIYGHGKGADSGRTIKLEDVEQYSTYNANNYIDDITGYRYNDTKEYTNGSFYLEEKDENEIKNNTKEIVEASDDNKVIVTQTRYKYDAEKYFINKMIYNMFMKKDENSYKNYFILDKMVLLGNLGCEFGNSLTLNGWIGYGRLVNSLGTEANFTSGFLPVVKLNTNIQTIGQDSNGVWQLKVD